MTAPILITKLHFPLVRSTIVPRPRLVSRLHGGLSQPLTIISAPAGYGKTTLLSEWRANVGKDFPAAWLSLDAGDNDVRDFLNYLVVALESAGTGLAGKTLILLQSASRPAAETVLASLVDDLAGYPHDLAIILDDYHTVESAPVHDALKFLLEHLPPQVHLILLTRADPPLPLARLRSRGQMTEIRAADLRFTNEESAAFLNDVMGLSLSAGDVGALEARTEGWVAGLQLAALSMQGRSDIPHFINAFTGSHRYIVDYLAEEVLSRQPAHIRDFLLKTSILERMSASLCDALLENGQAGDSQTILEYLERTNIFLTPLDDERRWYRYHHLFADVLRNRLQHSHAESLTELYRRAIAWYEQNDLIDQAIQHALALKDYEYAAQLLHRHWLHLLQQGHVRAKLIGWVESLPQPVLNMTPRLCMVHAWMLMSAGNMTEARKYVACLDGCLEKSGDENEQASLSAEALAFHAFDAQLHNDSSRALELAQRAQALALESALFTRGAIATILTNIQMGLGNIAEGLQFARQALTLTRAGGTPTGQVGSVNDIAKAYWLQGQPHLAMDACKEALEIAEAENQARFLHFGILYQRMASIFYEWNDLDQADRYLGIARQMADQSLDAQQILSARLATIQLRYGQGDLPAALSMLADQDALFQQYANLDSMSEYASFRARWQAALGQTEQAQSWLDSADLSVPQNLGIVKGVILLNAAQVMLSLGQYGEAIALLQKIETASADKVRYWQIVSLVLQAVALQKKNSSSQALGCLEKALGLAEKGSYVRIFLDQTPVMIDLLKQAASRGIHLRYTTRLLDSVSMKVARPASVPGPAGLLEPLSSREQEVLNLIARGRLNKEIADELVIAIGTVKRHTANIFRKLDVINRTQAVARSRELGLL